jgi:hypothetical protein
MNTGVWTALKGVTAMAMSGQYNVKTSGSFITCPKNT